MKRVRYERSGGLCQERRTTLVGVDCNEGRVRDEGDGVSVKGIETKENVLKCSLR